MVFSVLVAAKTCVTGNDLPSMGHVAGGASRTAVVTLLVQLEKMVMAGLAVDHGFDFGLSKMTRFASR